MCLPSVWSLWIYIIWLDLWGHQQIAVTIALKHVDGRQGETETEMSMCNLPMFDWSWPRLLPASSHTHTNKSIIYLNFSLNIFFSLSKVGALLLSSDPTLPSQINMVVTAVSVRIKDPGIHPTDLPIWWIESVTKRVLKVFLTQLQAGFTQDVGRLTTVDMLETGAPLFVSLGNEWKLTPDTNPLLHPHIPNNKPSFSVQNGKFLPQNNEDFHKTHAAETKHNKRARVNGPESQKFVWQRWRHKLRKLRTFPKGIEWNGH